MRGEGEEGEMGEEKQSSHDPLYTNKHSAPSPLNMSCHSLCPIVHTTTMTTRGMMMRLCIQPSPSPHPAVASEFCTILSVRAISGLGIPQK